MRIAMCLVAAMVCGWTGGAAADLSPEQESQINVCHKIGDKSERVDCYDRVTRREEFLKAHAASQKDRIEPAGGILGELWGLDKLPGETRYEIKQYHRNYIIGYSTNPFNSKPETSTPSGDPRIYDNQPSTDPRGLKFQISGKAWLVGRDDAAYGLWLAYTQQSWWQVLDASNSRPFRETDFQPELIVSLRPELFNWPNDKYDFKWRLLNFGGVHQSNGQSGAASRSWNRVYAEVGFERDWEAGGQLALLGRAWARIREDPSTDDNPGITRYLGYGDLKAMYRNGNFLLTALARGNPNTGKGAGEISLAFPMVWGEAASSFPFKWYLQLFTGYGEGLLDYNWRQTFIGFGITLNDRK